jgi:hypothetical protein
LEELTLVKDLDKFYNSLKIIDKTMTKYEDEDGNYSVLPTSALLVGVDYNEFEADKYKVAVFEGAISKDFETEIKKVKRPVPKFEITKNPADKYTITEKEVAVRPVWFVVNTLGIKKAFNNKEEALNKAKEINKVIIETLQH